MRILYHHRTLADGAEGVHIRAVVDAFRSIGHDVTVLGVDPEQQATRRSGTARLSRVRAMLPAAIFELAAIAMNLPEALRALRAIRSLRPHFAYKRHARYDVGTLLVLRWCRVPVVLEVNCLFTEPPYVTFEPHAFSAAARWFERRSLALASAVLTVSSPLRHQVARLSDTPVHVVPNGVDVSRFDPARAHPDDVRMQLGLQGRVVVGWVGVIREWHGLDLLLDALAQVNGATLLVVGDGPGRAALEARAETVGLGRRIVVTGRVPHDRMPDYVATMDVAVVADERTGVASPMKLLEYLAMGCAVVAPKMPNVEDVVRDGQTGMLFSPGDSADLAGCLQELLDNPARRHALGERARQEVVSDRSWRRIAERAAAMVPSRSATTSEL